MIGTDKASLALLASLVQVAYGDSLPPLTVSIPTFLTWSEFGVRETCGFIAQQPDGTVIVAFRGTDCYRCGLEDADIGMTTSPDFPGCRLHAGFLGVAESVQDSSGRSLPAALLNLGANLPVTLTGHSLGGAVARIWAGKLDRPCVTFAEPRTGDTPWAAWSEAEGDLRLVNRLDLIPELPLWTPFTPYSTCAGPATKAFPPLSLFDLDPLHNHRLATYQAIIAALP